MVGWSSGGAGAGTAAVAAAVAAAAVAAATIVAAGGAATNELGGRVVAKVVAEASGLPISSTSGVEGEKLRPVSIESPSASCSCSSPSCGDAVERVRSDESCRGTERRTRDDPPSACWASGEALVDVVKGDVEFGSSEGPSP